MLQNNLQTGLKMITTGLTLLSLELYGLALIDNFDGEWKSYTLKSEYQFISEHNVQLAFAIAFLIIIMGILTVFGDKIISAIKNFLK